MKGFTVDTFTDPKEAVEQFQPNAYDVIVTDIKMPEMNGLEVYKKIREKSANVKVYFLSAFESYESEINKMSAAGDSVGFIKKPVTYGELAKQLIKAAVG
jgi:DNA-binding response OmpR family regulator